MRWTIIITCTIIFVGISVWVINQVNQQNIIELTEQEKQSLLQLAVQHAQSNPEIAIGERTKSMDEFLNQSRLRTDQSQTITFQDIDWTHSVYPQGGKTYGFNFLGMTNCSSASLETPLGTQPLLTSVVDQKPCQQWWSINITVEYPDTIIATRATEVGMDESL